MFVRPPPEAVVIGHAFCAEIVIWILKRVRSKQLDNNNRQVMISVFDATLHAWQDVKVTWTTFIASSTEPMPPCVVASQEPFSSEL